ncbi:MAG: DDE-type integrase/transposase/recombinase [Eubacteriales bacterium]|nr:DDE-type integrase/transposase/recombinase [Eubacteriales bacterium]
MNQLQNPRELRGLAILSQPDTVREVRKNHWMVKSQSGNGEYLVTREYLKNRQWIWTCACPDHTTRHLICKHIYAVQFSLKLKDDVEQHTARREQKRADDRLTCPYCKSVNLISRGKRKNQRGEVQVYGCKECGRRFTRDLGFNRMKHTPETITLTLDLYFKGLSDRKIVDHLKQFHKVSVVHTTVLRWIKKYLKLLGQYAEKNKVDVGNVWHSDEMTVFLKKEDEKRYYQWIWNIMDAKTRYLLACQVTEERQVKDARKALKQAKDAATIRPDVIVTDGLQAYKEAIRAEFFDRSAFIQNPHLRLKDFETKPNNNIVERLNGTFRERTKVIRSFPDQISANEFCAGMQVYYNYIRPHQGIDGLTPAQMAQIPINLSGNRWMTMIELATKS